MVVDAVNIKKEAEFMMYVPYNEVVESEVDDKILIQGVVDLLIEKENSIIIVDYNTACLNSFPHDNMDQYNYHIFFDNFGAFFPFCGFCRLQVKLLCTYCRLLFYHRRHFRGTH